MSGGNMLFGQANGAEMPFAVRGEEAVHQKSRAAVLKVVTLFSQFGNTTVSGADAVNFLTNILGVAPRKYFRGIFRIGAAGRQHGNFPFILRLGQTRAGNLRAVYDAALGAGFRPSAALFVA